MNAPRAKIDFERIANQAEKRIDQIFKQPAGSSRSKLQILSNPFSIVHHFDRLHKILLSIELQDTDELIIKYFTQLEYLKQIFRQDKYLSILITLQYNLSNYIKTNKKNAHPFAFKILRSVFKRMCDVFYAKNMQSADRIKIINEEIIQYNKFLQFVKNRARAIKRKPVTQLSRGEKNVCGHSETADQEGDQIIRERLMVKFYINRATADLKNYIRTELEKLKTEIQAGTIKNGS
jgi:hypothetical protein